MITHIKWVLLRPVEDDKVKGNYVILATLQLTGDYRRWSGQNVGILELIEKKTVIPHT